LLAGAAIISAAPVASAQSGVGGAAAAYPIKPIRLIVPFAPGGGIDILARAIGQKLTESMGQAVVVDNRGGGSGIAGTELVARAAPDGYTLLFTASSHTINPSFFSKLPYDAVKDFAAVTQVTSQAFILGVHPGVPARSVKELIALAKSKPGQLNFGSGGNGNATHLGGELLKQLAGIDLVHVPYKGGGPALLALISGEVTMLFSSISSTLPQVKSGRVRALAVSSARRSPAVPDLATVAESGVPGFELTSWYGLLGPAQTPKAITARLHAEVARALHSSEIKARLASDGNDIVASTPAEFTDYLEAEIPKWARVIKTSGARMD
jgi:tripartite-type tricarboxylate transporter receptor subunit TctC